MKHALFLDYQLSDPPFRGLSFNEAYELIMCYVKSLQNAFHLGRAIIYLPGRGVHVRFPFARLTAEEVMFLTRYAKADRGYCWWTEVKGGRQCLRSGKKIIVVTVRGRRVGHRVEEAPRLMGVMDPGGWRVATQSNEVGKENAVNVGGVFASA